jgi:hypothetical protein
MLAGTDLKESHVPGYGPPIRIEWPSKPGLAEKLIDDIYQVSVPTDIAPVVTYTGVRRNFFSFECNLTDEERHAYAEREAILNYMFETGKPFATLRGTDLFYRGKYYPIAADREAP